MATLTLPQTLQNKLTAWKLTTGLIIGFQNELKYYCSSLAPTPHTDIPAAASLEGLLQSPLQTAETHYSDWVLEHARQAQRMLPGGLAVLGFFACSEDEQLADFKQKPAILRQLTQIAEDMNKDILQRDSILLLHCWSDRQKLTCRMIESKEARVNVVETKVAAVPRLEEVRGVYRFDAHFSAENFTVKESVEKILTNFAAKLNLDRVLVAGKSEGALPALRTESDSHPVTILSSAVSSYLSHTQPPQAQISVAGAMETRCLVSPKSTVAQAADLVRSDLVQSLRYRLSLHRESLDEDGGFFAEQPSDGSAGTYALPNRVFYQTEAGVTVCDYMFPEEKPDQSHQRVLDLTGFTGINVCEASEQPIKTVKQAIPRALQTSNLPVQAVSEAQGTGVRYLLYAVAVAVVAFLLVRIL